MDRSYWRGCERNMGIVATHYFGLLGRQRATPVDTGYIHNTNDTNNIIKPRRKTSIPKVPRKG